MESWILLSTSFKRQELLNLYLNKFSKGASGILLEVGFLKNDVDPTYEIGLICRWYTEIFCLMSYNFSVTLISEMILLCLFINGRHLH